jgi:hypothetical protein
LQKRKIKFALVLSGMPVRTLEDLRVHFDGVKMLEYFKKGTLQRWLEQRNGHLENEQLQTITSQNPSEVLLQLYRIFGISPDGRSEFSQLEQLLELEEKRKKIELYTTDASILEAVDSVAFSQEEMDRLAAEESEHHHTVYLLGEIFHVKDSFKHITYIGLNRPTVYLVSDGKFLSKENQITFQHVTLSAKEPTRLVDKGLVDCKIDETNIKVRGDFKELKDAFYFDSKKFNMGALDVERLHMYKNTLILLGRDASFSPWAKDHYIIFYDIQKKKIVKKYKTYMFTEHVRTARENNMFYYTEVDETKSNNGSKYSYKLYAIDLDKDFTRKKVEVGYLTSKRMWKIDYIIPNGDKIYFYDTQSNVNGSDNFALGYQCHDVTTGKLIKLDEIEHDYVHLRGYWGWYAIRNYTFSKNQDYYFIPSDKQLYTTKSLESLMDFKGLLGNFAVHNDVLFASSCEIANEGVAPDSEVKEGAIGVYSLKSKKRIKTIKAHDKHIEEIHVLGDTLVTVSPSSKEFIKLWDLHTCELIKSISFEEMERNLKGQDSLWSASNSFVFDIDEDQLVMNVGNTIYIYE